MARKLSKDVEEWSRNRDRAAELARQTVSGVLIDDGTPRYSLRWRAYFVGDRAWDRLLNWESRSETEIRDAASKLGHILEWDNDELRQDGEGPLEFNSISESGLFLTESEWLTEVHDLGRPQESTFPDLLKKIGLPGWESWEVIYVLALRMVDDAIRHHVAGRDNVAETLLLKALDEIYLTELLAGGRHRNTEHIFFKADRMIAEKEKEFWLRDALKERQKNIAGKPRANPLTVAIRQFAEDFPEAGWKELLRFLLNHPSLICREVGEDLEWEAPDGEFGEDKISGLPARLSRARKYRVAE